MPTILTHPAVPIALGMALGPRIVPARLLLAGIAAAILPDLDVLAFRLHIPYAHDFGHRGASHSLVFAAMLALLAWAAAGPLGVSRRVAFPFVFIAAASHGLLDMLTNGGMGVALAWPVSDERFFFPLRVIEASPLSLKRLLGPAGAPVLLTELVWVWLPALGVALLGTTLRRMQAGRTRV